MNNLETNEAQTLDPEIFELDQFYDKFRQFSDEEIYIMLRVSQAAPKLGFGEVYQERLLNMLHREFSARIKDNVEEIAYCSDKHGWIYKPKPPLN